MTSNLRTDIELRQVYDKVISFTRTTTTNAAETVLTISDYMEEGNRISIMVEGADLYVRFDGSAAVSTGTAGGGSPPTTALSLYMPAGQTYSESGVKITGDISIIVAANNSHGRIRGTIWGR